MALMPGGGLRVFPWIFRVRQGGKFYNRSMKSLYPRLRGFALAIEPNGSSNLALPAWRNALRSVPVNCTSLFLPYMGVTPASDNGGPVSIDQPEVTR